MAAAGSSCASFLEHARGSRSSGGGGELGDERGEHRRSRVDLRDTFEGADDVCVSAIHIGANIIRIHRYSPGI